MATGNNIKIITHIPYYPGNLAKGYNEFMAKLNDDEWALLLDHDVLLLRPEWHEMCIEAIKAANNPGWITGRCNEIFCKDQLCEAAPKSTDIKDHIAFSNILYDLHGSVLKQPDMSNGHPLEHVFSGMFILTSKEAWNKVGGFEEEVKQVEHVYNNKTFKFNVDGFLGVDNDYFLKLINAGYNNYILPGLYMYHLRKSKELFNILPSKPVSGKMATQATPSDENDIGLIANKVKPKDGSEKIVTEKKAEPVKFKQIQHIKPKKKATISVCMMVRGEEENMHRCLKSVKGVDEIIVVDTRKDGDPPDKSDQIAKGYGAKVYYHPWFDDFSGMRNISIPYCTKDWLLFIDADEELRGTSNQKNYIKKLKWWLASLPDDIEAVKCTMADTTDGKVTSLFHPTKIFRNGKVHYEDIVHNRAVYKGSPAYTEIVHYRHYGYDQGPEVAAQKLQRTSELLLKRLDKDSKDYNALFYLSQLFGHHGKTKKQLEFAEKYVVYKNKLKKDFNPSIYFSTARGYMKEGNFEKAKEWIDMGLKYLPNDLDLTLALAEHSVYTRQKEPLYEACEGFLNIYDRFGQEGLKSQHFIHGHVPEAKSWCAFYLGAQHIQDGFKAMDVFEKTLSQTKPAFKAKWEETYENFWNVLGLKRQKQEQVT